MKSVKKFLIPSKPGQHKIKMPKAAEVLAIQGTHDSIYIDALVNDKNEEENRTFGVYQYGDEVNEFDLRYIGKIDIGTAPALFVFENK